MHGDSFLLEVSNGGFRCWGFQFLVGFRFRLGRKSNIGYFIRANKRDKVNELQHLWR